MNVVRAVGRWALRILGIIVVVGVPIAYGVWMYDVWDGKDGVSRAAAIATIVQAPLVVFGVGIAAWQVVQSARESRRTAVAAREQGNEAAALERARTRPYVAVSFDMERVFPSVYLDVVNHGPTVARNVVITITPPFVTSLTKGSAASRPHDAGFLTGPIGTLVPQQRLSTLAEIGPHRGRAIDRGEDLPTRFNVHVTYEDSAPAGGEPQTYEDDFVLDFALLLDLTQVTRHTVHDLVDRVEKLTGLLASGRLAVRIADDKD